MKTRIKLKDLGSYVDLSSNKLTLYITYSIHGRRDYTKASALGQVAVRKLFPPILKPAICCWGWGDAKCKTIRFTVALLIADRPVYKTYDSWRG